MIKTDILIIGAGPCGLFTVFEAGLLKLRCHLVDTLPQVGGQLSEIYPKKPIYDIPGYPSILAQELADKLMEQAAPFKPGFSLGERAEQIERLEDDTFLLTTNRGTRINAPVIAIAGGLGCFEPRKPPITNLERFEDKGVDYIIPGNDDAARAISLYCDLISRACIDGIARQQGASGVDLGAMEAPVEPALEAPVEAEAEAAPPAEEAAKA